MFIFSRCLGSLGPAYYCDWAHNWAHKEKAQEDLEMLHAMHICLYSLVVEKNL